MLLIEAISIQNKEKAYHKNDDGVPTVLCVLSVSLHPLSCILPLTNSPNLMEGVWSPKAKCLALPMRPEMFINRV